MGLYYNEKNIDYYNIDVNKDLKIINYIRPNESLSLNSYINHQFICTKHFDDDTIIKVVDINQNVNTISIENPFLSQSLLPTPLINLIG